MQPLAPLPNDFGSKFVKMRYHALYVGIVGRLTGELNEALKVSRTNSVQSKLGEKHFWDNLKQKHPLCEELDVLEKSWHDIRGFSYLSTRKLLELYKTNIRPLEQAYLRASFEIEHDLKHYQEFGIWRPNWYLTRQQNMLDIVNQRLDAINAIRNSVIKELSARCLLYKKIGLDRHDDDIEYGFCKKLSKYSNGDSLKGVKAKESCYLSDDERLEIYDILVSFFPEQKEKYFCIVDDVRKALFKPVVEQKANEEKAQQILGRIAKIEKDNQLISIAKLKAAREKAASDKLKEKSWFEKIKGYVGSNFLVSAIVNLYRLRYIFLTAITMTLFIAYVPMIVAPIAVTSQSMANAVTGFLLFGFGLAPALIGCWGWIVSIYQGVANYFCYSKRQSLHFALEIIKDNQRSITELLTSGIHDTAHVDLNRIESWVARFKNVSKLQKGKLPELSFLESIFASTVLKVGLEDASNLFDTQASIVKKRMRMYAKHIVDRVDLDLVKLMYDAQKGIELSISKGQIKKLKRFVEKYGTKQDIVNFIDAVSLMPQFKQSLFDRHHLIKTRNSANTPWGGFKPFKSSLTGWGILLEESRGDSAASAKLISLMKGDQTLSKEMLNNVISTLDSDKAGLLPAIQAHLFACLDALPKETVHLLSVEQKRLVREWYDQNHSEVDKAMVALKLFVKCQKIGDNQENISNFVGLLDGAAIASQLLGSKTNEPYRIARQALKKYNGSNPKMFYLMRFFSEPEKNDVIHHLATKRLEYFLENPTSMVTNTDKDIFINIRHLINNGFDFSSFIKQHPSYAKPWSQEYEFLLKKFRRTGLDNGELLKTYRKLNQHIKSYNKQKEKITQAKSRGVVAHA